ncbi:MAG: amino acid permease, partial [Enterobacteriaceae bacterium]
GKGHVAVIANNIFGLYGEKIILFCVMISVLGTLNGKVIGGYRYPYALAEQKDIPYSNFFLKQSAYGTNGRAALLTLLISCIWFTCYTLQALAVADATPEQFARKDYLFSGITFEDIPIMIVSFEAIALMVAGLILGRRHKVGLFKTYIAPVVGIIGQVYVVISFSMTNTSWLFYTVLAVLIIIIGVMIRAWVHGRRAKEHSAQGGNNISHC